MAESKGRRQIFRSNVTIMLIVLAAIIVIFSLMNHNYLTYSNFSNILMAASTTGLLAIGQTCLIIAGHIDLSCAGLAAMSCVLTAILVNTGIPFGVVMIIVVLVGVVGGLINSGLVNIFGLQPFIATLAMSNVFSGAAYLLCSGKSIPTTNQAFNAIGSMRILGIPLPAVLMIICFVVIGIVLARTVFGRGIYMIGGNPEAARLSGINPKRVSTVLYVLSAAVAAFAGILLCAKMHSGQPSAGSGAEFDAITAAVLGGVSFTGGTGTMVGCFIGLLVMQCFNNGLTLINLSSFWQIVAKGLLLIAALIIDYFRVRRMQKNTGSVITSEPSSGPGVGSGSGPGSVPGADAGPGLETAASAGPGTGPDADAGKT